MQKVLRNKTQKKKTIAFIFARGGSKGLPFKNKLILAGHPLVAYSINISKLSPIIDDVYVSTDSEEIAEVAHHYGCEVPFMRPSELASDLATDKVVFEHALKWLKAEQNLTPELFNSRLNASHDDILFAPPKTPEIVVSSVKMTKDGSTHSILENFTPTPFLLQALEPAYPTERFAVSV